jgi:hypothetical protein
LILHGPVEHAEMAAGKIDSLDRAGRIARNY